MSDSSNNKSSQGFGALGLLGTVASIIAYCKTPSFVGWAGAGKALLVGAGTSMGASIVAVPAALGGFLGFGTVGLITRSKETALVFGLVGAIAGGLGGAGYGAYRGYNFSKDALTEHALPQQVQVSAPQR